MLKIIYNLLKKKILGWLIGMIKIINTWPVLVIGSDYNNLRSGKLAHISLRKKYIILVRVFHFLQGLHK